MKTQSTLLLILLFLFTAPLAATTISPYPNLGEMAKASEVVVLAQVERNYTTEENGMTRYRSLLRVVSPVKGDFDPGETLVIQNYHTKTDELERTIWGDLDLLENRTYLLFLHEWYPGIWQASMLSYGALELQEYDGQEVLVPFDLGQEVHIHVREGQTTPEPLGVYFKEPLVNNLRSIVQGTTEWNRELVLTSWSPDQLAANGRGNEPDHCTFLSSNVDPARWENIETTPIPVRYAAAGASDCADADMKVGNAISAINNTYLGVNLSNSGTHSFVPTCSGEGATDGEFTTWVSNNLGGSQNILVQFDDPCSEIADLNGCNGTLAIGGLYWFGSTYTYNNMSWRRAAYGYVVFNNGTGACKCAAGDDYEIIMIHELSHTLNIGHIEASDGAANMNPNCCETIQPLDIACFDFIYAASAFPVALRSFTGQRENEAIQLQWIAETEVDNDYYQLERLNRQGTFEMIHKANGMGTTYDAQSYEFTDYSPLLGTNTYRLTQTDFDGSSQELGIVSLEYQGKGGLTLELSPNPVAEQGTNIYIYSLEDVAAKLSVTSLTGQRLVDQQIQLNRGINRPSIDFNPLPAGIYLLQVSHQNEQQVIRFVKN